MEDKADRRRVTEAEVVFTRYVRQSLNSEYNNCYTESAKGMATKAEVKPMDYSKYDFHDSTDTYAEKFPKGISEAVVKRLSERKGEPEWMMQFRIRAYRHFVSRPMPTWGADLSHINFEDIYYYMKPTEKGS